MSFMKPGTEVGMYHSNHTYLYFQTAVKIPIFFYLITYETAILFSNKKTNKSQASS